VKCAFFLPFFVADIGSARIVFDVVLFQYSQYFIELIIANECVYAAITMHCSAADASDEFGIGCSLLKLASKSRLPYAFDQPLQSS
jgi:hypothetical protein